MSGFTGKLTIVFPILQLIESFPGLTHRWAKADLSHSRLRRRGQDGESGQTTARFGSGQGCKSELLRSEASAC
eukprot:s23_g42.t1